MLDNFYLVNRNIEMNTYVYNRIIVYDYASIYLALLALYVFLLKKRSKTAFFRKYTSSTYLALLAPTQRPLSNTP